MACSRFGRFVWAISKHVLRGGRCLPDVLARAERELPAGFFTLAALERFMRLGLASRGYHNSFANLPTTLLIPAVDLNTAERVVFGTGELASVPISDAVAASSAIPGFFDPYTVAGRDYVDGGVGFSGHADLAAGAGADVVFVVNPLVPNRVSDGGSVRARGVYTIMEQAGRIYSQNLLQLGMASLAVKFPRTTFHLLQPPQNTELLFGPSMGFAASQAALRFGYTSTRAWLDEQGAALLRQLTPADLHEGRRHGPPPPDARSVPAKP
jgi:NTE family protein